MSALLDKHSDKWHPEPNSGCFIWTASCVGKRPSRPSIKVDGKHKYVAREVCKEKYGDIGELEACHKRSCSGHMCVNPDHIYPGTRVQNEHDKTSGRDLPPYVYKMRSGRYYAMVGESYRGSFNTIEEALSEVQMAMYPTNTKLEDWLTTWLMNEVDDILFAQKKIEYVGEYVGMTKVTRVESKLPHDRATCIEFIKQHNPKAGAQFHD